MALIACRLEHRCNFRHLKIPSRFVLRFAHFLNLAAIPTESKQQVSHTSSPPVAAWWPRTLQAGLASRVSRL